MNTLGSITKTIFEHTPEAHKLRIEFEVTAAKSVHKGDLVVLAAAGTIEAAAAAAPRYTIVGVAMMDGDAGEFVTVAMRAAAVVINAEANAALNAGPCQLGAWNAVTSRREYGPDAGADAQVKDTLCIGHNLVPAAADGDPVKVAILL